MGIADEAAPTRMGWRAVGAPSGAIVVAGFLGIAAEVGIAAEAAPTAAPARAILAASLRGGRTAVAGRPEIHTGTL